MADLRKLKDQAFAAVEKRNYAKAADLYAQIAQIEGDADWRQRAGEAYRKAGRKTEAVEQLQMAVDGYGQNGFLIKAIAVCKAILQIDPQHTSTQSELARLFAMRDRRSMSGQIRLDELATPQSPSQPLSAGPTPRVLSSGAFPLVSPEEAMAPGARRLEVSVPDAPLPTAPPPAKAPTGQRFEVSWPRPAPAAVAPPPAPAPPIDQVPLHRVLPSSKSDKVPIMREPLSPSLTPGGEPPTAYDIPLDDDDMDLALMPDMPPAPELDLDADDDDLDSAIRAAAGVMDRAPAPPPPAQRPSAPTSPPPPPKAARPPATPPPPPRPAPRANPDTDFSALLDDSTPMPKSAHVPPADPRPNLPEIPLFSSLDADELREVIEGVAVRDFARGDLLIRQGEMGGALYVIVQGRVRVYVGEDLPQDLAVLGEGAFVGELALLTDLPRSASVVAESDVQALEVSRELIAQVIANSPEVLRVLLRFFRERMVDRFLRTSPLFARIQTRDARELMRRFRFIEADAGSRLVAEGVAPSGLFLLLCGDAVVTRRGQREAVARLASGDYFGESALLAPGPALATIDCATKCWLLCLTRQEFNDVATSYPLVLDFVFELGERRKQPGASQSTRLV